MSFVLAPDVSPADRKWIGTIGALLKYHQAFEVQPDGFSRGLEGIVGRHMGQLFLELYIHAQAAPWLPQ
jgi:hypothetical protein